RGRHQNGSRLSGGASAGGRKRPALRYQLAGAQTSATSERRPRQLQPLVRPPRGFRAHPPPQDLYEAIQSSLYRRQKSSPKPRGDQDATSPKTSNREYGLHQD